MSMPLDIAGLVIVEAREANGVPRPRRAWDPVEPATRLGGLAAWRPTQQVFRFDSDLYAALTATPVTGRIPGEHFRRLPAWAIYVETPGMAVQTTAACREPLLGASPGRIGGSTAAPIS